MPEYEENATTQELRVWQPRDIAQPQIIEDEPHFLLPPRQENFQEVDQAISAYLAIV